MFAKRALVFRRFRVPIAEAGAEGARIVVVNGAQQTMGSWFSFVRYFVPRGFRVVLFDFPGQGRGEFLEGTPALELDEQVAITSAVIDGVSPHEPVNLLGGSWGSVVCAATAARHPERVRQMVLGSFRTAPNGRLLEIAETGRRYVAEGRLDALAALFVEGFGAGLPAAKKEQVLRQMSTLPREHAEQLVASSFLFADGADISRHVDLGRIRARTLIVNGEADPIVDEENLAWAAGRIPDCRGHLVPGVGHYLHNEKPALLTTYETFFRGDEPMPPS